MVPRGITKLCGINRQISNKRYLRFKLMTNITARLLNT